jgi:hypothetical protein
MMHWSILSERFRLAWKVLRGVNVVYGNFFDCTESGFSIEPRYEQLPFYIVNAHILGHRAQFCAESPGIKAAKKP